MAVGSTGPEYVDLVFRTLAVNEAKQQAREVNDIVQGMGVTQRMQALEAGRLQQTWQEHIEGTIQRQNQLRTTIFQTLEIFNRVIGMARQLGAAIQEVASRHYELNSRVESLSVSTQGLVDSFAQGIADGGQFSLVLQGMTGQADGLSGAARQAGQAIDDLIGIWARVRGDGDLLDVILSGSGIVGAGINYLRNRGQTEALAAEAGESFTEWAARRRNEAAEAARAEREADIDAFLESLDQPAGPQYATEPARAGRGGRGGGGGRQAARQEELAWLEEIEAYQELLADQDAEAAERRLEDIQRESEAWAQLNQSRRDEEAALVEQQAAAHEMMLDFLEQSNTLAEMNKAAIEEFNATISKQTLQTVNAIGSALENTSSIMGELAVREEAQIANITAALDASGASQERIAAATKAHQDRLDNLKKAEGGFLIAYNVVMAATETAQAIASGAKYEFGAMAEHIAAAAAFSAAAVMAGIRLGDDGSGGGASSVSPASASFTPAASDREVESEAAYGTNVTIYTMGSSSVQLGQQLERARWELERSGLDPAMTPSGGYE